MLSGKRGDHDTTGRNPLPSPCSTMNSTQQPVSPQAAGALHAMLARLSSVSLGQVMLASLVLVLVAFFFRAASPALARWVVIAGLILFLTAFALSLLSGHSRHQRRWRGEGIDLSEPRLGTRLRKRLP